MKTSVTKIMMSFALMGCLIFSASDASAQGRSRSQGGSTSSRSQTAAVSRSSNQSTAPTVSRSSSSSVSRSTSATPQVSRSSSSTSRSTSVTPQVSRSSASSSRSTVAAPSSSSQVNRSSSTTSRSTVATPSSNSQVNRPTTTTTTTSRSSSGSRTGNGAVSRGGSSGISNSTGSSGTVTSLSSRPDKGITVNKSTGSAPSDRSITTTTIGTTKGDNDKRGGKPDGGNKGNGNRGGRPDGGNKGNGNVDNGHNGGKPDGGHNGNMGNDNRGGKDKNGRGGNGNNRHDRGGRPDNNRHGYDNNNHFDYGNHHYRNDFHHNYTNHSWSWSRPLPPPARPYRPAPLVWYRPVIPAGWHPYAGAPIIDRILGITFGTLFDTSLDYLYFNGYEIDGYADHIIYLRNVPLVNFIWDDVMLSYDSYDRLVNAQFVFQASHYSSHRYDRVYRNLCRVYGQPVARTSEGISWYGGNSTGWVTLSMHSNLGRYYTVLSIGY